MDRTIILSPCNRLVMQEALLLPGSKSPHISHGQTMISASYQIQCQKDHRNQEDHQQSMCLLHHFRQRCMHNLLQGDYLHQCWTMLLAVALRAVAVVRRLVDGQGPLVGAGTPGM
jgi:hypothetical protein